MILFLILCSMLLHLPSIFIVGKMPPVVQQMAFTSLIVCQNPFTLSFYYFNLPLISLNTSFLIFQIPE